MPYVQFQSSPGQANILANKYLFITLGPVKVIQALQTDKKSYEDISKPKEYEYFLILAEFVILYTYDYKL